LEVSGQLHDPAALPLGKEPRYPFDSFGLRKGLDDLKRRKIIYIAGLELRPLGRPARCQSLYRLGYPGSTTAMKLIIKQIPYLYIDVYEIRYQSG
jgi:hypothetical protein